MALVSYSRQGESVNVTLPLEKGALTYLHIDGDRVLEVSSVQENLVYPSVARADNGFYVMIARKEEQIKINGIGIFGLRVLRNADLIQIRQTEVRFYEWVLQILNSSSVLILDKVQCPFCTKLFASGDRVVTCPKCDTPLHDYCWISRREANEGCVLPNCGYLVPSEDPYIPTRLREH